MSLFNFTLFCAGCISYSVFVFFHTDAFFQYLSRITILRNLLFFDAYQDWQNKILDTEGKWYGYPIFFRETFDGFWSKLIGCPICLIGFCSIWVSLLGGFLWAGLILAECSTILYSLILILYKKIEKLQ